MAVNGELLGFVHESALKGSISRTELRALFRTALPFAAFWSEFESGIREDGESISLEEINEAAESESFLRALPQPYLGRTHGQNIKLIKVAAYLVANRLLSQSRLRRALSLFFTYEKMSSFRRFEATLPTIKKSLVSLSLLLTDRAVTAWLEATASHRTHEAFLCPHEFLFLISNAVELSLALKDLPPLDSDLSMRRNLFVIDSCTKGNPNPRLRAQNHLEVAGPKVKISGRQLSRGGESRRSRQQNDYLNSGSSSVEEFKAWLWDKELSKRVRETVEAAGPRKAGNSLIAKRYRELSSHHRISRSLACSPVPILRRPQRWTVKRH